MPVRLKDVPTNFGKKQKPISYYRINGTNSVTTFAFSIRRRDKIKSVLAQNLKRNRFIQAGETFTAGVFEVRLENDLIR